MKNIKSIAPCVLLALGLITLASHSNAAEYKLTGENTSVKFLGTKKDGKHHGAFPKLSGAFTVDRDITKARLEVTLDVSVLTTDAAKLTGHLKSPDFFDVKRYPEAKFVSKKIEAKGDAYEVTGDLTMHGQTKPLSFPAKIALKDGGLTASSQFNINRHDWGISYGKGNVNDLVQLTLEVNAK